MLIKTNRLIIREFTREDLNSLAALFGNAQVMEFSVAGPLSLEQTRDSLEKRILAHYAEYGFGLWALIHNGMVIGLAGLIMQVIDGEKLVELGYRLDPPFWGKGLATEAAEAIVRYALEEIKLTQIISIIEPKNIRSIAVVKKLGMHYWKDAEFHGKSVQVYKQLGSK